MSEQEKQMENASQPDVKNVVRHVIEEFMRAEQSKAEPAYKAELVEERKRREALEGRLNQLVEENRQARAAAEQMDRHSQIRTELQRLGVAKLDLAFKAVKDDIVRTEDGRLMASDGHEQRSVPKGCSRRANNTTSVVEMLSSAMLAASEMAAPLTPNRRISTKFSVRLVTSTVPEIARFQPLLPPMRSTILLLPVPMNTSIPSDRITSAVWPAMNSCPKTRSSRGAKTARARYSGQEMAMSHHVAVWKTDSARS